MALPQCRLSQRRAEDKESHVVCALKQIKMAEEKDGFPLSSIREINILLSLRHKNIVDVSEVVVGQRMDDIFMVMEYMEHDLKHLMNQMEKPFTITEVNFVPSYRHVLPGGLQWAIILCANLVHTNFDACVRISSHRSPHMPFSNLGPHLADGIEVSLQYRCLCMSLSPQWHWDNHILASKEEALCLHSNVKSS